MANEGLKLIAGIVEEEHPVEEFLRLSLNKDWFLSEPERDAFEFVSTHVSLYGAVPTRDTISEEIDINLPEREEPPQYYLDKLKGRYLKREVKKALLEANDLYKEGQVEQAMNAVMERMVGLSMDQNRKFLMDYAAEAREVVVSEYVAKWKLGDDYGIQLGYPTLDNMTGGLQPGDVFVVAGRPASGKTYWVMSAANHVWAHQKKVPLVLSMEMPIIQISQRMAAIQSKIPITGLRRGELASKNFAKLKKRLDGVRDEQRPFWLLEGGLNASVEDLRMYTNQLKPDVVMVDGAYLMHHGQHRSDWEKVKAVVEGLKQNIAQETGIPVVASYQLNREATKTKKNEAHDVGMLAYSDAIGQIASVVIGMLDEENIESLVTKEVSILKGRNGEKGSFRIHWLFDTGPNYMDFSEVEEESLNEMTFL